MGRISRGREETAGVRNAALHQLLDAFTVEASGRLAAETAAGAEMPFEVVDERGGGSVPLYRYRPLTDDFIRARLAILSELSSYEAAARALTSADSLPAYLEQSGKVPIPAQPRAQARAALSAFLASVFAERSEFGFEPAHFEAAYAELERALYEGYCTATVLAPLLGVDLDPGTTELTLGDGVSLVRGNALAEAPAEAVWGDGPQASVLAVLAVDHERSGRPPVSVARARFRRILTALRLFERGAYALGPVAWARTEAGRWRPVAIGASGRPRRLTTVPAAQEEELRAFYELLTRRPPEGGELGWALARFEMGCERPAAFEALTDYLLALRALLEPEGPASGRLAQRLSVICARPQDRGALAERTAQAIAFERAVIGGTAVPLTAVEELVDELAEHLRAMLRDALCGHLDADLRGVADDLLAEAAALPALPAR